jgi:hypothetical protein
MRHNGRRKKIYVVSLILSKTEGHHRHGSAVARYRGGWISSVGGLRIAGKGRRLGEVSGEMRAEARAGMDEITHVLVREIPEAYFAGAGATGAATAG